jgi:hypothetical protein
MQHTVGLLIFVLAKTVMISAVPPFDIHSFSPFRKYVFPSGESVAREEIEAASLPLQQQEPVNN